MLMLALGSVASRAQTATSRPNLSGLWQPVGSYTFDPADPRGARAADLERYPMTPWGLEQFKANKPAHGDAQSAESNDPTNKCFPPGAPRSYVTPYPVEFVQSPTRLAMLFEYDVVYRTVYLDGRGHPKDAEATWMGHSIGKWEGNTLVVQYDRLQRQGLARSGRPPVLRTARAHRALPAGGQGNAAARTSPSTIRKPTPATGPGQKIFKLKPTWELKEYVCEDNYTFDEFQAETGVKFVK
jgi:hypothetical protein